MAIVESILKHFIVFSEAPLEFKLQVFEWKNQNSQSSDNFHAFVQSRPTRQRETTRILPDLLILILIHFTYILLYIHELIVKVLYQ